MATYRVKTFKGMYNHLEGLRLLSATIGLNLDDNDTRTYYHVSQPALTDNSFGFFTFYGNTSLKELFDSQPTGYERRDEDDFCTITFYDHPTITIKNLHLKNNATYVNIKQGVYDINILFTSNAPVPMYQQYTNTKGKYASYDLGLLLNYGLLGRITQTRIQGGRELRGVSQSETIDFEDTLSIIGYVEYDNCLILGKHQKTFVDLNEFDNNGVSIDPRFNNRLIDVLNEDGDNDTVPLEYMVTLYDLRKYFIYIDITPMIN